MKPFLFVSLLGLSNFVACGEEEEKVTRTEPEGANPGECTDGADNDFDGDYDCNDSDCAGSPDCLESDCDDGADNDQDGDFDCDDSDCADTPQCATEDDCADGADNDADGLFDCDDPDCVEDAACVDDFEGDEAGECTDGADNDSDGLFDCEDPDCANSPDCEVDPANFEGDEPGECSDGVDNDQDGEYDCNDQDCEGSPDCQTTYTLIHSGATSSGGDGKRWMIARNGNTGAEITLQNIATVEECASLCEQNTTFTCNGFMYKTGQSHNNDEVEFFSMACTLMEVTIPQNTQVENVYSYSME